MDTTRQPPPPPLPRSPSPPSQQQQQFQVEITVVSAKHLKNVNWKQGDLKPYAVVYLDQDRRVATKPDEVGSTKPVWNERFVLPLPTPLLEDAVLSIEIFHSKPSETPKSPFVGAARLPLVDLLPSKEKQPTYDQPHHQGDQSPLPGSSPVVIRTLELRRSSGRPQGKVRIKVSPITELPPQYTSPPAPPLSHTTTATTTPSVPPPPPEDYRRLSSPSPNSSVCFNTIYADYVTAAQPPPPPPRVVLEDYRSYSSMPAPPPNHYVTNPQPSPQMPAYSRPPYTTTGSFSDVPSYSFGGTYNYPSAGSGYYSAPPAPPRMLQQNTSLPPVPPHGSSLSTHDFPSSGGPSAPLDYYAGSTASYLYKQQRERVSGSGSVGTGVDTGVPAVTGSFRGLTLEEGVTLPRNYEEDRRGGSYRDFRQGF